MADDITVNPIEGFTQEMVLMCAAEEYKRTKRGEPQVSDSQMDAICPQVVAEFAHANPRTLQEAAQIVKSVFDSVLDEATTI